jgi:hypothetical protein
VTDIMGLECSGYLVENGIVNKNKKVMALLPGGGYAEYILFLNIYKKIRKCEKRSRYAST